MNEKNNRLNDCFQWNGWNELKKKKDSEYMDAKPNILCGWFKYDEDVSKQNYQT